MIAVELALALGLATVVAGIELASRFRDAPMRVLWSAPGGFYLLVNAGLAAGALGLAHLLGWSFGLPQGSSPSTTAVVRGLAAGFGAAVLIRSSLFTVRIDDKDVGLGPGAAVTALLTVVERAVDRHRAVERLQLRLLDGLTFAEDGPALVELSANALQIADLEEADRLGVLAADLVARNDLSDAVRMDRLGLALVKLTGERALAAAAGRLREDRASAGNFPVAEKRQVSEPMQAAQAALLAAPTEPRSYVVLARALIRQDEISHAIQALNAARGLAPGDLRVRLLLERLQAEGLSQDGPTTLSDLGRAEAAWWQACRQLGEASNWEERQKAQHTLRMFDLEESGPELKDPLSRPEPEYLAEIKRHCDTAMAVPWPRQTDSQLLEVARRLLIGSWPEAAELLVAVVDTGLPDPPERWKPASDPPTDWPTVAALATMLALHGEEGVSAKQARSTLAAMGAPPIIADEDGRVTPETIQLLLGALRPIPFDAPLPLTDKEAELLESERKKRTGNFQAEALVQYVYARADDFMDISASDLQGKVFI